MPKRRRNPRESRSRADSWRPSRIQPRFTLMLSPAAFKMMADHSQIKGDVAIFSTAQGVRFPGATDPLSHSIGACGSTRLGWGFAAFDHRHNEGLLSLHQDSDDLDTQGIKVLEEMHEHLILGHIVSNPAKGQGIAFATPRIGGGVGEKVCGAWFGFASADLLLMLFLDSAMIGQLD